MVHQLKLQNPNKEIGFVLGNGLSRNRLNHTALKSHGTIYGCNAIYREFDPDFLICVDVKMINEVIAAGYHRTHSVWTNPNKGVATKKSVNFFHPHKGWSSGPTALSMAADRGHKQIYIFGFDYEGVKGKFNNVYADTYNYKKSTDTATYHGNWLSQTEKTIRENKHIQYYRVIPQSGFIPDRLHGIKNLQHLTYEDFGKFFQDCIYEAENNQKTTI